MTVTTHVNQAQRDTQRAGDDTPRDAVFSISRHERYSDAVRGFDCLIIVGSAVAVLEANRSDAIVCAPTSFVKTDARVVQSAIGAGAQEGTLRGMMNSALRRVGRGSETGPCRVGRCSVRGPRSSDPARLTSPWGGHGPRQRAFWPTLARSGGIPSGLNTRSERAFATECHD
jgi:hypothetical protein